MDLARLFDALRSPPTLVGFPDYHRRHALVAPLRVRPSGPDRPGPPRRVAARCARRAGGTGGPRLDRSAPPARRRPGGPATLRLAPCVAAPAPALSRGRGSAAP